MRARDIIELLFLGAIWGASFLFMRVAVPEFGPVPLIAMRVGIAALFLSAVLISRRGFAHMRGHIADIAVVGITNTAVPFSLFAFAVLSVSAGFGSILNATAPLFGVVIAYLWLRERLTPLRISGVAIGFVGVVILVFRDVSFDLSGTTLAVVAGLAASLLYGFAANYTKRRLAGVDPLASATGSLIAATLFLAPLALLSLPAAGPSLLGWVSVLILGLLCTGVAYMFYFHLIQRIGPSRAVLVAYLIPVFGTLWGALFLGETTTATMLVGGGVILLGTALATGFLKVSPQETKS